MRGKRREKKGEEGERGERRKGVLHNLILTCALLTAHDDRERSTELTVTENVIFLERELQHILSIAVIQCSRSSAGRVRPHPLINKPHPHSTRSNSA